jgi:hypothetical protein
VIYVFQDPLPLAVVQAGLDKGLDLLRGQVMIHMA